MRKKFLETGKIVTTHGVAGEVRVYPWCDGPDFLLGFDTLYLDKGKQPVRVENARVHKNIVILKLAGVDTMDDALLLRNKVLYIDRDDVELAEGEYFVQDLIGLVVLDAKPFIEKCKESVWKYKGMWEDFSGTVGFWADMDDPYVTYHDDFIESEWWALKEIWNKDLLYKGFKIVPYCPRCGTPLSSQEVAQGYKDVKERSAVVRFKCKDEDAYILAWTTTPWTLPSNVALCMHPDYEYVKVKSNKDGFTYYMAQALVAQVLGDDVEVLESYRGKDLEHKEYVPLFPYADDIVAKQGKKGFYVVCDEYVTLTDGTGVVHIAPAFGEDDANVGRKYDLPFVQLVDGKGEMTEPTPWAGTFVKKEVTNPRITEWPNAGNC